MPSKFSWTTPDGLTRYGGPRTGETSTEQPQVNDQPRYTELRSGKSLVGWFLVNNSSATGALTYQLVTPFGEPCIRLEVPNDTGSVDVIADDLGLTNFTAGTANLVWHVYVEDELAIKQWQVHAGNDTSLTRNITNTYNLSNNNLNRANGDHIGSLNPDNATANTLLTTDTVNRLRLRFFGQPSGSMSRYVWIRGVYVPEKVDSWMVLTFDDADISLYTRTHRELEKRGLKATFGMNWDDGVASGTARTGVGAPGAGTLFLTPAMVAEMYAYGHDVASHNTKNDAYPDENPPTTQPSDTDRTTYCDRFRFTRNLMRELGYKRSLGYHPFVQGAHDGALVNAMKAHGVSVMRTTGAGNIEPFRADLQSVFRQRQLGNAFSLATAKTWVDSALLRKQDVMIMGHALADTATDSITWAQRDFASFLDYAKERGIRVGSVSEWASFRNVVV